MSKQELSSLLLVWSTIFVLIPFGVVLAIKPNLFRRWFWKRPDSVERLASIYMRVFGVAYIVAGILLIVFARHAQTWLLQHWFTEH